MGTTQTTLAAVAILLTSACGSSSTTEGDAGSDTVAQTSASSATSSTLQPPATTSESTGATTTQPLPPVVDLAEGRGSVLQEGIHRALPLGSGVGLSVSGPVEMRFHSDDVLALARPDWPEDSISGVGFFLVEGVIPAAEAGIHQPDDLPIPLVTEPTPDDLGTWLESIAQVKITDTGVVSALDGSGEWVAFEIDPNGGETFSCPSGTACVGLVVGTEGVFAFVPGEQYRMYRFDSLPRILAWERADAESTSEVNELMVELIDGLVGI
jgi:hypothetical protein